MLSWRDIGEKLSRSRDMTVLGSWSNFSLGLTLRFQHMLLLGVGLGLGVGSDKRIRVSNRRSGPAREQVEKVT